MMSSGPEKKDYALLKLDVEAISCAITKYVCGGGGRAGA